jgi:hypothetical protein
MKKIIFLTFFSLIIFADPKCLSKSEQSIQKTAEDAWLDENDVFTRLVFTEGISAFEASESCQKKSKNIFQLIAWGVWSRKELAPRFGKDLKGVIFKKGQFNPAVSLKSKYSDYFLCPEKYEKFNTYWKEAEAAVKMVVNNSSLTPFKNPVTHFYYPKSRQATAKPPEWADIKSKNFVKESSGECLWFFRH